MNINTIQEKLLQLTTSLGSILFKQGREIVSGIFLIVFNFMIMVAALFFMFREGEKIPPFLYSLLPFPDSIEEEIGGRLLYCFRHHGKRHRAYITRARFEHKLLFLVV